MPIQLTKLQVNLQIILNPDFYQIELLRSIKSYYIIDDLGPVD